MERRRIELYRARERYVVKLRMLGDDPSSAKAWSSATDKQCSGFLSGGRSIQGRIASGNSQNKKADLKAQLSPQGIQRKDAFSGSESQNITQSGLAVARKRRVHSQVRVFF